MAIRPEPARAQRRLGTTQRGVAGSGSVRRIGPIGAVAAEVLFAVLVALVLAVLVLAVLVLTVLVLAVLVRPRCRPSSRGSSAGVTHAGSGKVRSGGHRLGDSESPSPDRIRNPAELGINLTQRGRKLGEMIGESGIVPPGDVNVPQRTHRGS
jgi:hypothetical protein